MRALVRAVEGLRAVRAGVGRKAAGARPDRESGSAVVEFLGVALLLLVPLLYLVAVLGRVQSASYAVEAAARAAGRAVVVAEQEATGVRQAIAAVQVALADQGVSADPAGALRLGCSRQPCLSPGGTVTVTVRVEVPLPGMPSLLDGWVPARIPVEAVQVLPVDAYAELRR